jgi:hypothetical protein
MTINRIKFLLVPLPESTPMSDPPLPGEQSPALAYALSAMDAYVSERFDALAAKAGASSSPVAQLLQTAGVGIENRRREAVERLSQLTPREADVWVGWLTEKTTRPSLSL